MHANYTTHTSDRIRTTDTIHAANTTRTPLAIHTSVLRSGTVCGQDHMNYTELTVTRQSSET